MMPSRASSAMVRETVSIVSPRWSAMSYRIMGSSMWLPRPGVRAAMPSRRHLLPRILAAQQDHVALGLLKPSHHRRHQFCRTPGIACWGPQLGAQPHLDSHVTNRRGRALMTVATFEAERIAGKVEGIDLATPIAQQPVCSHGTCDELVEDTRAVAFDEDLVVPGKSAPRP